MGIAGEPDRGRAAAASRELKTLIYAGFKRAIADGARATPVRSWSTRSSAPEIARSARRERFTLAMPVERSGQAGVRLRVRDRLRRAHRGVRPGLRQGARALQPRRRRALNRRQAGRLARCRGGCAPTTAGSCSSCSCRRRRSNSSASAATRRPTTATAPRARRAHARQAPGRRRRARHLEDRGPGDSRGLRASGRPSTERAGETTSTAWCSGRGASLDRVAPGSRRRRRSRATSARDRPHDLGSALTRTRRGPARRRRRDRADRADYRQTIDVYARAAARGAGP